METFESIGEIAATLAGFSAILVAIRFERLKPEIVPVQDFLLTALSAILFAFMPKLLSPFAGSALWQVSCGVFGAYHALLAGIMTYRHLRERMFSTTEWLFVAVSIFVISVKISVGLGFLPEFGYEIYLLGLLWFLLNSMFMFYGLFFRVIWGNTNDR